MRGRGARAAELDAARAPADIFRSMVNDLRRILHGWNYEPGKISVRKIIGRDGRDKVQTRVDMGVLQFETVGRPDGARPHGCESLLDHYERRLSEHHQSHDADDDFVLRGGDCEALRHEAHLYYQRFLSMFVLEDYDAVARDTRHNLRVIELCGRYAHSQRERDAFEAHRAYTLMMNARARTYRALREGNYERALSTANSGIRRVSDALGGHATDADGEAIRVELRVMLELRNEVFERMPADCPARLQHELEAALAQEDYERAARLRDALSARRAADRPA